MTDLHTRYIHFASQTYRSFDDLENPNLRQSHNEAMRELHKMETADLFVSPDKGAALISSLLKHEDERVRISAAAYCLKARIFQIRSRLTLLRLSKNRTLSGYIRTEAAQCMKYCKPYSVGVSREGH